MRWYQTRAVTPNLVPASPAGQRFCGTLARATYSRHRGESYGRRSYQTRSAKSPATSCPKIVQVTDMPQSTGVRCPWLDRPRRVEATPRRAVARYYTNNGNLVYAGRVGTGMPDKVLADLRRQLEPLARASSPLSAPPCERTRFGSPLVLSRVYWVEPELVAEITYLTWTADELLRHTVYLGLRSDKPARDVRRERR